MWTRVASGAVLAVITLVTLICGGPLLAAVCFMISVIGYMELCKATGVHTKEKFVNSLEVVGILGITAYYAVMYFCENRYFMLLPLLFVFMCSMLMYVLTFPKYRAEQVMANFFHFVYAPIMLSFIFMTRNLQYGEYIVWLIFLSSWGSDTFAYFVGICIGKKKVFPVLSPKKSLEGCIGGVVGAGLLGAGFGYFFMEKVVADQSVTLIIAFICMIGAVMSQLGDLAASAIKRNHEIKDYGKLIPGHGGIMDRFDSVIVTAPLIFLLTVLLIK